MKTHLSHSSGDGDLAGQHGMSLAVISLAIMWSAVMSPAAAIGIASAIGESEAMPAITGRDIGAKANPATTKIASRRRMVIRHFTPARSHGTARIDSPLGLTTP